MTFTIPKEELEKISEYVTRGIAASKQSDSQFWGEVKTHMIQTNDKLDDINEHFKRLNGSVARHEQTLSEQKVWRGTMNGWIKGIGVCLGIIIVLSAFIFNYSISNLSDRISQLDKSLIEHVKASSK